MIAKIIVTKTVLRVKKSAHRSVFTVDAHRNAVKFALSAQNHARINVNILNAQDYATRPVIENLALYHAISYLIVVTSA